MSTALEHSSTARCRSCSAEGTSKHATSRLLLPGGKQLMLLRRMTMPSDRLAVATAEVSCACHSVSVSVSELHAVRSRHATASPSTKAAHG